MFQLNDLDGTKTAYFRGRKLRGRPIKLPKNYHGTSPPTSTCRAQLIEGSGLAISMTEEMLPTASKESQTKNLGELDEGGEEFEDEPQDEPVKILKEAANFDEITIWGHDSLPSIDDAFIKGIEEWIGFAEAVRISS